MDPCVGHPHDFAGLRTIPEPLCHKENRTSTDSCRIALTTRQVAGSTPARPTTQACDLRLSL
jgi:hypothetical protein